MSRFPVFPEAPNGESAILQFAACNDSDGNRDPEERGVFVECPLC